MTTDDDLAGTVKRMADDVQTLIQLRNERNAILIRSHELRRRVRDLVAELEVLQTRLAEIERTEFSIRTKQ